jgi:murein DD-endopeptidase MepM/ murein hydrolase activator NlpD
MPPRPHPLVLASLAFGCAVVMALVLPHHAAGASAWGWPLRGPVVGAFHISPRAPFARGQRRGIDVSARPGAIVRAACPGRVSFTGALPHRGLAVTVRCGSLIATYLGLGRVATRTGSRLARGDAIGTLGASGRLRLGARRASDRRGYVDPLLLLADGAPPLPHLGPAPRALRRPVPPTRPAPRPIAPATPPAPGSAAAPRRLPWPAYPALVLVASGLPLGGLLHRRRRRRRAVRASARSMIAIPGTQPER